MAKMSNEELNFLVAELLPERAVLGLLSPGPAGNSPGQGVLPDGGTQGLIQDLLGGSAAAARPGAAGPII